MKKYVRKFIQGFKNMLDNFNQTPSTEAVYSHSKMA